MRLFFSKIFLSAIQLPTAQCLTTTTFKKTKSIPSYPTSSHFFPLFSNPSKSKIKYQITLTPEREISFKHLSSGERQVIYIFLKVANATKDNALILMDEPEISLHLAWQEKLISEIRKVNDKSQLIIVTHSPAIVMNGWMDSFIDINDIFVGE